MDSERIACRSRADLLTRRPCLMEWTSGWEELVVDPVARLSELADLLARRLISQQEYRLMKDRIVAG
jgi:hypothetical protein